MLSFLPQTVNRIGDNSRVNVSKLIRDMKLSKSDATSLVSSMSAYSASSYFSSQKIPALSVLNRDVFIDLFRDSFLRMRELYRRANSAGLVINSMVDIYTSEIEKIENDIEDLNLFIENYEFLSGKDDYYNFNYIEKFDNSLRSMFSENYVFSVPDRDNVPFGENGSGFVDSVSGVFKIGSSMTKRNLVSNIKSINVASNYGSSVTSQSDPINVINDSIKQAWNVTVKSKAIIANDLLQYKQYFDFSSNVTSGAQAVMEIELNSSTEIDTIRISPVHGKNLKILQAVVFTDNANLSEDGGLSLDDSYIKCLSSPKLLDSMVDIKFPASLVKKIILIFNEQGYVRSGSVPINSEVNSKLMQDFVNRRVFERVNSFSKIQDIVFFLFRRNNTIKGLRERSSSEYDFYSYRFPAEVDTYLNLVEDELFTVNNTDYQDRPLFHTSPIFADLVLSMSSYFDSYNDFIDPSIFVEGQNRRSINSMLPSGSSNLIYDNKYQNFDTPVKSSSLEQAVRLLATGENADVYEYSFGIKSLDFYLTDTQTQTGNDKACFVSSKIDSPGQVIGLKAKVIADTSDVATFESQFDIGRLFSYELSVTNKQNPVRESDWIPLMSYESNSIDSEVVFFDTNSLGAKLRFKAVPSSITLYKNGLIDESIGYTYSYGNRTLYLTDPQDIDPSAIWCVSYSPDLKNSNPFELDFQRISSLNETTKVYYGSQGSGERFSSSGNDGVVTLSETPYINSSYLRYATYTTSIGTKFSGPATGYSPIKITLSDGTVATNMTNYSSKSIGSSFPSSGGVFFIQNGKRIIFNSPISQAFTVDYEYSSSDTRFRLVVRRNVREGIPAAIDSVIIKAKVNSQDPYYDRIRTIKKI